ncbi:MAG: sulfotransferase [Planctomycetota bacterium]|nr:sulfotransferase [Planctomycetota bacterium]
MRLPDFLIVGAARCGTTWLYECLRRHPQVYLPPEKRPEPHFFLKNAEYERGLRYYSDRYFVGVGRDRIAGEASTSYLYHPSVAPRIAEHLPGVRLIAILRNPVDRAFSNYIVSSRNGFEPLGFSEAIRVEPERLAHPQSTFEREICPFAYIDRGRYSAQLARYLELFPGDRLHVALFDDLVAAPGETLRAAQAFLDVDPNVVPEELPPRLNAAAYDGAAIPPADRTYILDRLRDDLDALAAWLDRDLSHWT